MSAVALNVLPVFALILIGWLVVRAGYLRAEVGDGLGQFVFRLAVPVLLFRTIAEAEFSGESPMGIWIAYFAGVAVTWTAGHLTATRLFARDRRAGVLAGVAASFANNVFIGLPLVARTVGDQGLVAVSVLLSVHLPVMMVAGTLLMERAERKEGAHPPRGVLPLLGGVAASLMRNPFVVGLAAGGLYHLTGLPLDGPAEVVVDQISATAGPAALLSIGMSLDKYRIGDNLGIATAIGWLKLFLLPGAVYLACLLVGLGPEWTAAMVLTAAVPTGINAWLLATHFNVGQALASSTIALTTVAGFVTVSFWAWLLG